MEGRALFPLAIEVERSGEPEAAEEVCAERVAGPVCAEIDAGEADGGDERRGDDKCKAARPCVFRQHVVGGEEREAEVTDGKRNVVRRDTVTGHSTIVLQLKTCRTLACRRLVDA